MPHGGKRPGAGRKKGSRGAAGLAKDAAREFVRQFVTARLGPMLEAQAANAIGIKYLVVRDAKTGKFVRVSEGMAKLAQGEERIEVWEKDPSVQAFTDLLNRALDLPAKPTEQVSVDGKLEIMWKGPND